MSQAPISRRDRKKAATRRALADAATRLFLERGFDTVSIREIADAADVSVTTVFKHFTSKEALLFDADTDREAELIAVVEQRSPGQSIPQALCAHFIQVLEAQSSIPQMAEFIQLIRATPALSVYARQMWTRHETALALAIARDVGAPPDDVACAALARFALEAPNIAREHLNVTAALGQIFAVIEQGWASGPWPVRAPEPGG